uniref:non-specific serine/threonine protein kinase n=1 Tax=Quercus lobata TaxID=97700 RepID=A0A7N2L5H1_QUELO
MASKLDTLVQGQELKDGDNLVSAHGKFKLGLFHLTSNNYYLGKWYNGKHAELENLVWVANRDTPIFDNSGNLTIDDYGNLKISHNGGPPLVLYSAQEANNTSAALLETGNLVLSELNSGRQLWQSFDYPTHTLLQGMKLGVSRKTGHTWSLKSWISSKVPAASSLTFGMDPKLTNQLVILSNGTTSSAGIEARTAAQQITTILAMYRMRMKHTSTTMGKMKMSQNRESLR